MLELEATLLIIQINPPNNPLFYLRKVRHGKSMPPKTEKSSDLWIKGSDIGQMRSILVPQYILEYPN